jgi:hypothetical protein
MLSYLKKIFVDAINFFPQTIVPYCVYSVDGNEGPFQVDENFNCP